MCLCQSNSGISADSIAAKKIRTIPLLIDSSRNFIHSSHIPSDLVTSSGTASLSMLEMLLQLFFHKGQVAVPILVPEEFRSLQAFLTDLAMPGANPICNAAHLQALPVEAGKGVAVGDELAVCFNLA